MLHFSPYIWELRDTSINVKVEADPSGNADAEVVPVACIVIVVARDAKRQVRCDATTKGTRGTRPAERLRQVRGSGSSCEAVTVMHARGSGRACLYPEPYSLNPRISHASYPIPHVRPEMPSLGSSAPSWSALHFKGGCLASAPTREVARRGSSTLLEGPRGIRVLI